MHFDIHPQGSSILDRADFPYDATKNTWPWVTVKTLPFGDTSKSGFPRISIITPSYNQGQFIEETIRSVLLQGYPNLEYIIIDGGSTDGTVEVIKKYAPWLTYWCSETDRGQGHAINKGIKRATGDALTWLNADDIYLPNALLYVGSALQQHQADWIVGITLVTDIHLNVLDRFVPQLNTGYWRKKGYSSHGWLDYVMTHQSGTALPQPSSFWSRDAILKAGGIDESLHYAMDHDLYGRLAFAGYRPVLIPQTLAYFRSHQQQKTRNFPFTFWQDELRSTQHFQQLELASEEKQTLKNYEIWFARYIQMERLMTTTGLKKLHALLLGKIVQTRKRLGKLKRSLMPGSKDLQKGIVSKNIIARYIPKNPVIVEAGAHIGLDTEELAEYFPNGKIYAFEPVPSVFLKLSERTKPYKNVQCIPMALSNQVGNAIMFVSGGVSDGSSSLLPPKDHLIDHPDVTFETKIHVECTTLDEWSKINSVETIDLLWLDMQGHELHALKAGVTVLENVQAIYTEVNLKEVYDGAPLYSELRAWLETRNFKVEIEEIPWNDGGNVLFVRNTGI